MKEREKRKDIRKTVAATMVLAGLGAIAAAGINQFGINSPDNINNRSEANVSHAAPAEKILEANNQIVVFNQKVNEEIAKGNLIIDASQLTDPDQIQQATRIIKYEKEERPVKLSIEKERLSSKASSTTKKILGSGGIIFALGALSVIDRIIKFLKTPDSKQG